MGAVFGPPLIQTVFTPADMKPRRIGLGSVAVRTTNQKQR